MFEGARHVKTLLLNGEAMTPSAANIKYANRLAVEIKDRIRHGTFSMVEYFPASGDGGALTVAAQLDAWLGAQRLEASTRAGYESGARFWKGAVCDLKAETRLGDKPLRALLASHVMTAIASRPELSGKTINNYVQVLREAVALAVADKILTDNPVVNVPAAKHQKEPPDPFTREEMEAICTAMRAKHDDQCANLVEVWFWTGMRTSEIFGLQWANVDLVGVSILVTEAVVRGERKQTTKTHTARTVKLNSRAMGAIQRQRKHTQMSGGPVFHDPRYGTPWLDERAFRRSYWTPILKLTGIRYRRPYNMRHTYATMMLMVGMNPAFCAKQLGHSVEMFHQHYAKWLDGDQNDMEMARLETSLLAPENTRDKIKGT